MSIYNPSALLSSPNSIDLVNLFKADGLTTGFGVFTDGTTPSVFTSWNNFKNACKENGFFTGNIAKAYYNPQTAQVLAARSLLMDTGGGHVTIDGIEYKMRSEGVTTGDFAQPTASYAAGMATCDILQTLSDEGFATGSPTFFSDADPALVDTECIDGRGYGSGCLTPTMFHLGETTVGNIANGGTDGGTDTTIDPLEPTQTFQTDGAVDQTFSINVSYPSRLIMLAAVNVYLAGTYGSGDDWGIYLTTTMDGTKLNAPYIKVWSAGHTPLIQACVGSIDLAAGVNHTLRVKCKAIKNGGIRHAWKVDFWAYLVRQAP